MAWNDDALAKRQRQAVADVSEVPSAPLAALVFCRPGNVDFTIVNGVPLVEHSVLTALDIERIVAQHNELARALVS